MKRYLEEKPFICIPSETYFSFTKRRLKEGQNVLLHLARYRPSNFGISTGILMHIIRHVCHSPVAKQKYLRDALRDIRFQEVMSDYGMFFLHDLDLDRHCIDEIPSEDPDECKMAMSIDGKVPKPVEITPAPNSQPTGLYPLGDMPAWSEVKVFIGRSAGVSMNKWVWDLEWDEENALAAQLFIRFTREYFATLKLEWLRADAPNPICLHDAMKAWTVEEIGTTLTSCWFIASNHGLKGKFTGARTQSFRENALGFFPPDSTAYENSSWAPFIQHGYMGEYFQRVEDLGDEEHQTLMDDVCDIFGRLQCLPVITTPSQRSKGKVWTSSQDGIHLLTNPIFYKLKGIGSAPRTLTGSAVARLPRVKASDVVINRRFIEMHGGSINTDDGERRNARRVAKVRTARLSTRTKNRRQPPTKRGGNSRSLPEESEAESSGMEEDELEEDEVEDELEVDEDESEEDESEEDESEVDELDEDG